MDNKLDRLEEHIMQLINMVAENNKIVKETVYRMDKLEDKIDKLEGKICTLESSVGKLEKNFDTEKQLNSARHWELIKEMRSNNIDINYLRNEISKHDMEINKLKSLTNS